MHLQCLRLEEGKSKEGHDNKTNVFTLKARHLVRTVHELLLSFSFIYSFPLFNNTREDAVFTYVWLLLLYYHVYSEICNIYVDVYK